MPFAVADGGAFKNKEIFQRFSLALLKKHDCGLIKHLT